MAETLPHDKRAEFGSLTLTNHTKLKYRYSISLGTTFPQGQREASSCSSQGRRLSSCGMKLKTQKAEVLLKITQINRMVKDVNHSIETLSESKDSIKNILKDLHDIINAMNKYDRSASQDFVKKIDDISRRMTQVNLGQETVKEAVTELKTSLTSPISQKHVYYQTVECNDPHYETKIKHPRLSSNLNFAYFDKHCGEVLEVTKNREVRRGLKERFLELHGKVKK